MENPDIKVKTGTWFLDEKLVLIENQTFLAPPPTPIPFMTAYGCNIRTGGTRKGWLWVGLACLLLIHPTASQTDCWNSLSTQSAGSQCSLAACF